MSHLDYEQKIKRLLSAIGQQGASDLHLAVGRHPSLRLDGRLVPMVDESDLLTPENMKGFCDVLLGEKEKKELFEDGQTDFSYNFEEKARFRVNAFSQKGYISIAMRFVGNRIRSLEELNLPESLYEFSEYPQGLVLVTGPVGHGKSTTLAAIIDHINHTQDKHIVTIEDPIEYVYTQDRCIINQREVGKDAKSFSQALHAVFREDVNIVLLGELRDLDTIGTAMTAAETGHLIFATLHTNDSAQTVDRIIDVFPAHQQNQIRIQLANVLVGVVSQRLVPKIGGGRMPVAEIMLKNHAVENLIRENKAYQIDSVIETSLKEGMVSLDRALADMVLRGEVDANDAFRFAKNPEYMQMLMHQ